MPKEPRVDSSLRFYYEVLGLDRLHYGLWENDPMNFEGLKAAQERYESRLLEKISDFSASPGDTLVLDAGCGSGEMVKTLLSAGFKAEGLSPDPYQQKLFAEKTPAKFHLCTFQDFDPGYPYDTVLMSESAQYIPLDGLFQKTGEILKNGGHLILSDYFCLPGAAGPQSKSGHYLEAFLQCASENGFILKFEQDITDKTSPTLELAMRLVENYIIPSIDIMARSIKRKRPVLAKIAWVLFKKRILKVYENAAIIDAGEFKKNKRYMLYIFQNEK